MSVTLNTLPLGTTTDLVNGYTPSWDSSNGSSLPFYPSEKSGLRTEPVTIDTPNTAWNGPNITLCDTPEDLITALYDYRVANSFGDDYNAEINSGPLVLNDADRSQVIATLKNQLGIDLSTAAGGYALVEINRVAGTAGYTPILSDSFFHTFQNPTTVMEKGTHVGLMRLAPGEAKTEHWMTGKLVTPQNAERDLTVQDVQTYIDFYKKYGSHFVSQVTAGDVIYQIFAYDLANYTSIKGFYSKHQNQLHGDLAVGFQLYTNPVNGSLGYASQVGKLLIKSSDSGFTTAVNNGDWKDASFGIDSVFAPFIGNDVNIDQYQKIVPIGFELRELTEYAEWERQNNARRIIKSLLYAKYGKLITPKFRPRPTYDYQAIFPESIPGYVSTIATPKIDIYKERLDLSNVQLVAAKEVKQFTQMTQVTQLTGKDTVIVPGDDVVLIAHTFDFSYGNLPVVQLTDAAFSNQQLYCQDFNGPLILINTTGDKRQVIVDGFTYTVAPNSRFSGRNTVGVSGQVTTAPPESILENITTDIDFSLTASDIILHARSNSGAAQGEKLILKYLNWIGLAIPEDTTNTTLQELRVRAMYMARVVAKLKFEGIDVPYLKYETYQPTVADIQNLLATIGNKITADQTQISLRKLAELDIDIGKALNKNIIESGKLLSGFIGDMAAQQSDLSNYYGQIISQDKAAISGLEGKLSDLSSQLNSQQTVVSDSVEAYKTAVADWETMEIIKFSLGVAAEVFTLGVTFAAPATSITALASLGEMAQKIAKAIKVFAEFDKIFNTVADFAKAMSTLNSIGYDGATFPSELEWDEFLVNMTTCLNQGPPVAAKQDLLGAFKILVLRGKALLSVQAKIQQFVSEVYLNKKRQDLANAQQKRLNELNVNLNPATIPQLDKSKVDLLGLTSAYQSTQNQMLAMLARTLVIQDSALQYEYLQSPTPISSFNLISLQQVIIAQSSKITTGMSNINPPPQPFTNFTYTIEGVKVSDLINGAERQFTIMLSAKEFINYAMVRVNKVVASVTNVKSTTGGEFELKLVFNGTPFDDRNQSRKPITYHTRAREFDYLYDASTGQPKFGDSAGTWSDQISDITPFSQWTIGFPENSINEGIAFDGKTVDITLTLSGNALLRPTTTMRSEARVGQLVDASGALLQGSGVRASAAPKKRKRLLGQQRASTHHEDLEMMAAAPAAAEPVPTIAEIVSEMNGAGTVMRGWDVVFNLTQSKVNTLLKQQWDNRKNDSSFFYQIEENTYFTAISETTGNRSITQFQLTLGTPLIQFMNNNAENVGLTMDIESGTYSYGVVNEALVNNLITQNKIPAKYVNDFKATAAFSLDGDVSALITVLDTAGAITWMSKDQKITASDGDSLNATVPLASVSGTVADHKNVVLDLAQGAFTSKNMKFAQANPDIDNAIENYMNLHEINLLINTVDTSKISTLDSLKPNVFAFNTLVPDNTGASPILQIFISTGTDPLLSNRGINLEDPIGQGIDSSLMVNSKILFEDIFVSSFQSNTSNSGFVVTAIAPPPNTTQAYYAELTSGTVTGSVPSNGQIRISASSNNINIPLTGMTFKGDSGGGIQAALTQHWKQSFEYQTCTAIICDGSECYWNGASLPVTLNVNFPMKISISGTGADQKITIKSDAAQITVGGTLDAAGPCKSNARQVQAALLGNLQSQLPGPIAKATDLSFDQVSLFALQNLLFPASNTLNMTGGFAPSDLIVFGTITT